MSSTSRRPASSTTPVVTSTHSGTRRRCCSGLEAFWASMPSWFSLATLQTASRRSAPCDSCWIPNGSPCGWPCTLRRATCFHGGGRSPLGALLLSPRLRSRSLAQSLRKGRIELPVSPKLLFRQAQRGAFPLPADLIVQQHARHRRGKRLRFIRDLDGSRRPALQALYAHACGHNRLPKAQRLQQLDLDPGPEPQRHHANRRTRVLRFQRRHDPKHFYTQRRDVARR